MASVDENWHTSRDSDITTIKVPHMDDRTICLPWDINFGLAQTYTFTENLQEDTEISYYCSCPDPFLIFPNRKSGYETNTIIQQRLCNRQYTSNGIPGLSSGAGE